MSHLKDTDYLALSARLHVLETRLLGHERMERMIDAKDAVEAAKPGRGPGDAVPGAGEGPA